MSLLTSTVSRSASACATCSAAARMRWSGVSAVKVSATSGGSASPSSTRTRPSPGPSATPRSSSSSPVSSSSSRRKCRAWKFSSSEPFLKWVEFLEHRDRHGHVVLVKLRRQRESCRITFVSSTNVLATAVRRGRSGGAARSRRENSAAVNSAGATPGADGGRTASGAGDTSLMRVGSRGRRGHRSSRPGPGGTAISPSGRARDHAAVRSPHNPHAPPDRHRTVPRRPPVVYPSHRPAAPRFPTTDLPLPTAQWPDTHTGRTSPAARAWWTPNGGRCSAS